MVLTSVAPLPTFLERFRAAWRGDESLAWVFWCFYVLGGFAVAAIMVALLGVLQSIAGGGIGGFSGSPIGQAFILTSDLVFLGYLALRISWWSRREISAPRSSGD